jgi:hypothetical protein
MKCKGVVQEQNRCVPCWLPAAPSLKLCRRCHFSSITQTLDSLTQDYWSGHLHPHHESLFTDADFLQELLHPAREQALLNLFSALYQRNKIQFSLLVDKLKQTTVFSILLTKRVQTHMAGPRCSMYREFLKDPSLYKSQTHCWNCWACIAWTVKKKIPHLEDIFLKSFLQNLSRLTHQSFHATGEHVFLDLLNTFHLRGKDHLVRLFLDHCFHVFPLDDYKRFLIHMFTEPPFLHLVFEGLHTEYLPFPLRNPGSVAESYRDIKRGIKEKTDLYKEELMMRTWHPSRLFSWCLDIEEIEDFGISSADRAAGIYSF